MYVENVHWHGNGLCGAQHYIVHQNIFLFLGFVFPFYCVDWHRPIVGVRWAEYLEDFVGQCMRLVVILWAGYWLGQMMIEVERLIARIVVKRFTFGRRGIRLFDVMCIFECEFADWRLNRGGRWIYIVPGSREWVLVMKHFVIRYAAEFIIYIR